MPKKRRAVFSLKRGKPSQPASQPRESKPVKRRTLRNRSSSPAEDDVDASAASGSDDETQDNGDFNAELATTNANKSSSRTVASPSPSPSPPPHLPPPPPAPVGVDRADRPLPFIPYFECEMSANDCGDRLLFTSDGLTLTCDRGYRMSRAIVGLSVGCWYWECRYRTPQTPITVAGRNAPPAAARIGISTLSADLNVSCGADRHGYAVGSRGIRVHEGCERPIEAFGDEWIDGDVIGLQLSMPTDAWKQEHINDKLRKQKGRRGRPARAKRVEPTDDVMPTIVQPVISAPSHAILNNGPSLLPSSSSSPVPSLHHHVDSTLTVYRNGKFVGRAYENLLKGTYYPAVSLYMGATVTVNFGPLFEYLPEQLAADMYPPQPTDGWTLPPPSASLAAPTPPSLLTDNISSTVAVIPLLPSCDSPSIRACAVDGLYPHIRASHNVMLNNSKHHDIIHKENKRINRTLHATFPDPPPIIQSVTDTMIQAATDTHDDDDTALADAKTIDDYGDDGADDGAEIDNDADLGDMDGFIEMADDDLDADNDDGVNMEE